MTTVYLHIGMPKCASSALQSFMSVNESRHRSEGLCYPVSYRETTGYFSHRPLHRLELDEVPAAISMIAAEAANHDCQKIFISSEEFINSQWDKEITGRIIASLNAHFGASNVRIMMLFRNHFSFAESVYAQFLKGGMFRYPNTAFMQPSDNGISSYALHFRRRNGFDFFSYVDFIERIKLYAPHNPFDLISIERTDWNGKDIIDTLCSKLNVSRVEARPVSNERYSEMALCLLYYSRKTYGFPRVRARCNIIADLFPATGDKIFSKLLHVSGPLFDQLVAASERDQRYFACNASEPCEGLFAIPEHYRKQQHQSDDIAPPDWSYHLIDQVMQADEISLREAQTLKAALLAEQ